MEEIEHDRHSRRRKRKRSWLRPKQYKVADKVTLERIINPPLRPEPEFKGSEYVAGIKNEFKILYQCHEPNCNAKFASELSLTLHAHKHLNRQMRCTFCRLLFKSKPDLTQHTVIFHPDLDKDPNANPLQCKKCGRCTRDVKALWRHVRESHRNKHYYCQECDIQFKRPENLKEHLKIKHLVDGEPVKHVCKMCHKEFIYKNSLFHHIRCHHRGPQERTFRCVLCNTKYSDVKTYRRHLKCHEFPKTFTCYVCRVTFRSMSHLKRHEESRRHAEILKKISKSKTDIFPAPIIKTVTTAKNPNLSRDELIQLCNSTEVRVVLHRVDSTHTSSQPKFLRRNKAKVVKKIIVKKKRGRPRKKSPTVSAHYVSPPPLVNPLLGNPIYPCAKANQTIPMLALTEKTSNSKPDLQNIYLNCIYCDKEFPSLPAVKSHELICYMKIRNRKLFLCPTPECSKEFNDPYRFKMHCQTHNAERLFQCSYCDVMFKSIPTKVQHEKAVHFGIRYQPKQRKVYRCNYEGCEKYYSRPKGLKRHIAANHLGTRFNCEKCGREYRRKDMLRKHLRIDHADCPTRLECKPCNRTYKDKCTYLAHLERDRHKRKSRVLGMS